MGRTWIIQKRTFDQRKTWNTQIRWIQKGEEILRWRWRWRVSKKKIYEKTFLHLSMFIVWKWMSLTIQTFSSTSLSLKDSMKEKDISMKRLAIKREARRKVVITNPENIVIISIRKEATKREVIIMRMVVSKE